MAIFLSGPKLFEETVLWRVRDHEREYEVKTYSRSQGGGGQGGLDSVMAAGSAYSCPVDSLPAARLHVIITPDHKTRNERFI